MKEEERSTSALFVSSWEQTEASEEPHELAPTSDEEAAKLLRSDAELKAEFSGRAMIHHIDITCDGCDAEPIVGKRFKCQACDDRDLCEACYRNIIAARIHMSKEIGDAAEGGINTFFKSDTMHPYGRKKMISMLRSEEARERWAARMTAVPCLSVSHRFRQIVDGPERSIVLSLHSTSEAEDTKKLIDKFVAAFPPATVSCASLAWIAIVLFPDRAPSTPRLARNDRGSADFDTCVDAAVEAWEKILEGSKQPDTSDIDALARKFRILRGKWLIFPQRSEVTAVWNELARSFTRDDSDGYTDGRAVCTEIKVSTASPRDGGHVCCVYVEDYLNKERAFAAAEYVVGVLKPLQLRDKRLVFKPDIMTYLGIYKDNEYGIKPSVYVSTLS